MIKNMQTTNTFSTPNIIDMHAAYRHIADQWIYWNIQRKTS